MPEDNQEIYRNPILWARNLLEGFNREIPEKIRNYDPKKQYTYDELREITDAFDGTPISFGSPLKGLYIEKTD